MHSSYVHPLIQRIEGIVAYKTLTANRNRNEKIGRDKFLDRMKDSEEFEGIVLHDTYLNAAINTAQKLNDLMKSVYYYNKN